VLDWLNTGHRVLWAHDKQDLRPGDFCFYLSCGQIVPASIFALLRIVGSSGSRHFENEGHEYMIAVRKICQR